MGNMRLCKSEMNDTAWEKFFLFSVKYSIDDLY